jgi:hypothetical protein
MQGWNSAQMRYLRRLVVESDFAQYWERNEGIDSRATDNTFPYDSSVGPYPRIRLEDSQKIGLRLHPRHRVPEPRGIAYLPLSPREIQDLPPHLSSSRVPSTASPFRSCTTLSSSAPHASPSPSCTHYAPNRRLCGLCAYSFCPHRPSGMQRCCGRFPDCWCWTRPCRSPWLPV